ncbi:substrate-binding domain-containing protein, partial [Bacillus mycoides]|uniref:substrate-binding domain-containing protein n=1 Tax=Bacillus mycoides TaxID=1405 RepID=UPI0016428642
NRISIPDHFQIIAFDPISLTEIIYPSITTLPQPIYHIGRIPTQLLLHQINRKTLQTQHYPLPIKIIHPNTTN